MKIIIFLEKKKTNHQSPLLYSLFNGNLKCSEFLINKGSNVLQKDSTGLIPFHYIIMNSLTNLFDLILLKDIDVNYFNGYILININFLWMECIINSMLNWRI